MTTILLFGAFFALLAIGVPISVAVGITSVTGFWLFDVPVFSIPMSMYGSIDSFTLMASPLFIVAGNIMTSGGISDKLIEVINRLVGSIRGSLGLTTVISCAFFAALSGSGPTTTLAIGSTMYPAMEEAGYPKAESAGLIAVSGGLGPIIPPSIIMVIYATLTDASIKSMFTIGAFWGVIIAAVLLGICFYRAKKNNWPLVKQKDTEDKGLIRLFIEALPALLMPVIILGGIYGGFFTPTECAGVSVVYALFVGAFVYREFKPKDIIPVLVKSAKGSAMCCFVIMNAAALSWLFTYCGFSQYIYEWFVAMNLGTVPFLFVCIIVWIIMGCFIDGVSICVLLIPLLYPVALKLGINAAHFGLIYCLCSAAGTMTPPVATNIFSAAVVSKLSIEDISRGLIPYFIGYVAVVFIIAAFPQISNFIIAM